MCYVRAPRQRKRASGGVVHDARFKFTFVPGLAVPGIGAIAVLSEAATCVHGSVAHCGAVHGVAHM